MGMIYTKYLILLYAILNKFKVEDDFLIITFSFMNKVKFSSLDYTSWRIL